MHLYFDSLELYTQVTQEVPQRRDFSFMFSHTLTPGTQDSTSNPICPARTKKSCQCIHHWYPENNSMPEHRMSCSPTDTIKPRYNTKRNFPYTREMHRTCANRKKKTKRKKKRCTRKFCKLTESKQADARGTEEFSEGQLIPTKRLDSTMLPRSLSSWIISCMCWLQRTALTCNTWLLKKYSLSCFH